MSNPLQLFEGTLKGASQSVALVVETPPGPCAASATVTLEVLSTSGSTEAVGDAYITKGISLWVRNRSTGAVRMLTESEASPTVGSDTSMAGSSATPSASSEEAILTVETASTIDSSTVVSYTVQFES